MCASGEATADVGGDVGSERGGGGARGAGDGGGSSSGGGDVSDLSEDIFEGMGEDMPTPDTVEPAPAAPEGAVTLDEFGLPEVAS